MIDVYEEPGQTFYAFLYGAFEEVENYISIDDMEGEKELDLTIYCRNLINLTICILNIFSKIKSQINLFYRKLSRTIYYLQLLLKS